MRLENQRRRQKILQMNQQHRQHQLESLVQSRVAATKLPLRTQGPPVSKPVTTPLSTSQALSTDAAPSSADPARALAFSGALTAPVPTIIDIS